MKLPPALKKRLVFQGSQEKEGVPAATERGKIESEGLSRGRDSAAEA